jgi:hypothetical protein
MSIGDMGGELIALEWVAHGTNTDDEQNLQLQLDALKKAGAANGSSRTSRRHPASYILIFTRFP